MPVERLFKMNFVRNKDPPLQPQLTSVYYNGPKRTSVYYNGGNTT